LANPDRTAAHGRDDTAVGQVVLLLVGAVFTVAFVWLAKMTRPITPERFLGTIPGFTSSEDLAEVRS